MEQWKIDFAIKEAKNTNHYKPPYYIDLFKRYEKEKKIQRKLEWERLVREGDRLNNENS